MCSASRRGAPLQPERLTPRPGRAPHFERARAAVRRCCSATTATAAFTWSVSRRHSPAFPRGTGIAPIAGPRAASRILVARGPLATAVCASLARRLSAPARARPPFQHPRSLTTRRPTKAAACGKRPPGRDGLALAWRRQSECGAATATKTAGKRPQGRAATRSGRVVATRRPVRRRATRRTTSPTTRAVHPLVTPQGAAGAVAAAGAPGRLPQRARRGPRGRRRGSRPGQRRRLPCCRSSASPRRQTRPSTRWNGRLRTRRRRPLPCRAMSPKRPPCELKAQAPHQELRPPLSCCTWLCSTRPIQRAAARPPPPPPLTSAVSPLSREGSRGGLEKLPTDHE